MNLFADSSPSKNAIGKKLSQSGGFHCYGYTSNFKDPKLDALQSVPVNCRAELTDQDFPEHYGINGRSEGSRDAKKPRVSHGAKYKAPIAAVPLRSVALINVKGNPEKSVASHGKFDDVGQKVANNTEFGVQQKKCWNYDSERFDALLAEANELIKMVECKYSECEKSQVVLEEKAFGMDTKEEYGEEEVSILTPSEWEKLPLYHKGDGVTASIGKLKGRPEKLSSKKSSENGRNMVRFQGSKIVDLVGQSSVGTYCDQQTEGETKCGEGQQEHSFMDLGFMDLEPEYYKNHKLINLQIGQDEQHQRSKVMEAVKIFEEQYDKLMKERLSDHSQEKFSRYSPIHIQAAEHVKAMRKSIIVEKPFGHIPGIEIGDEFRFRAELAIVGLHCQLISGIDYVVVDGMKYATSVVDSGRYENKAKAPGVLIYSGQGGNPKLVDNAADQKLERGNLALMNSMTMRYPVRVIYKRSNPVQSKAVGTSNERNFVYVYDGLYTVNKFFEEREEQSGKLVFKFELHILSGQPSARKINVRSGKKPTKHKEVCVLDDVSKGKEKFRVRAMNGVDDDLPPPFTYMAKIEYPYWYQHIEPIGCDCTNGCSDSQPCSCVLKNGGEIPFNENGAILKVQPRVYECGPSCKCPPNCMNRVSQHGPKYELEIFKTKSKGWGVRSRHFISSGSFICEYVGELLRDKEAEQRIGDDEYLFDICDSDEEGGEGEIEGFHDSKFNGHGFALDAATCGNIGRFINHSCSPNLFAQEVLYDHDDKKMPHIMFFATEDIHPLKELSYDYNYKNGVCDANGNMKTKNCHCGSLECNGRLY